MRKYWFPNRSRIAAGAWTSGAQGCSSKWLAHFTVWATSPVIVPTAIGQHHLLTSLMQGILLILCHWTSGHNHWPKKNGWMAHLKGFGTIKNTHKISILRSHLLHVRSQSNGKFILPLPSWMTEIKAGPEQFQIFSPSGNQTQAS
jgi:hypothetical protein